MITRDPVVAGLVDEVISMAPAPPAFRTVTAAKRSRRTPVMLAVVLVAISVTVAIVIVSPWSHESRRPSVVAPARSVPVAPTTTLPLLTADQAVQVPVEQRVRVADRTGGTPGWVIHDQLDSVNQPQPVLVRVYNDAGEPVGYFGTYTGFVATDVAQAAHFDQLQYSLKLIATARGREVPKALKRITVSEYNDCMSARATNETPVTRICKQLADLQGWPIERTPVSPRLEP